MNLNKKSIGIIILLIAVIGGGFWYFSKEQRTASKEQAGIVKQQEVVKQDKEGLNNQTEDKTEELKIEDIKNIKPKFGIDDSGLKYSKDGSVDISDWKEYKVGAVQFKYPNNWYEIEFGVSNNPTQEINLLNKQIKIIVRGRLMDINTYSFDNINVTDEERWRKAIEIAKQWEINDFKKNSYNYKETLISDEKLMLTGLERKSGEFVEKYRKIRRIKKHLWDSNSVFVVIKNKNFLEKNRKIIDTILNSMFIFNEKYTE